MSSQKQSIAIVGGGAVGMMLAVALSKLDCDFSITLIEKVNLSALAQDQRAIALSYASVNMLNTLGLWTHIKAYAQPIFHIHVSDKGAYGQTRLHAENENLPFLGVIVKMSYIIKALLDALQKTTVDFSDNTTVQSLDKKNDRYMLYLEKNNTCKALHPDLIIGADGSESFVKKAVGIDSKIKLYHQSAVVFDVELKRDHEGWAYERFINSGVMAMLPLCNKQSSCVWTMSPDEAEAFVQLCDRQQLQKAQHTFGYRLGQFMHITRPKAFPLRLVMAKKLYQDNVLLFGNAAHFLHPVSGQGLNLSMRDIGVLYDLLYQYPQIDQKNTLNQLLCRYTELRQSDHMRTAKVTDGLVNLFVKAGKASKHFRSVGLHLLQRDHFAKKALSHLMMGKWAYGSTLLQKKVDE
ncbi:FAD-dependent monooxygenase [Facilibium subflavum]|uniref:FAD-dependent monooxygenase n=1 Tax=Facilibium subflavum TaxID=2219058 RepID=UPI000E65A371|nr:FAD-dependent monooxygenase [Facilibium subflavum]